MKQKIFLSIILISLCFVIKAQKYSRTEYIKKFKELSVKEMKRTGIPASITLAQGVLESNNGNSTLATKANNHFGIKCHKSWKGKTIKHDDDKKNECFRKYKSAYESYIDHSDFLTTTSRYDFLFKLKTTDYKSWAKGLKKAGYATSKTYAQMLIKIIEENRLYLLDEGKHSVFENVDDDIDNFTVDINKRKILYNNRVKYIITKKGDTFLNLTEEFQMMPWELYKYNDLPKDFELKPGQQLYLQPKRKKAEKGNDFHIVSENENMYEISQKYGIKLNSLYKMNLLQKGQPDKGTKLFLRKKKKVEINPASDSKKDIKVIFEE